MEKLTIKEFYKQLTKGKAIMIDCKSVKKGFEVGFESVLRDYASAKLENDLKEGFEFTEYELKSFGAVNLEGSELRHSKENTYYSYHNNMIVAKLDWSHVTRYLIYIID